MGVSPRLLVPSSRLVGIELHDLHPVDVHVADDQLASHQILDHEGRGPALAPSGGLWDARRSSQRFMGHMGPDETLQFDRRRSWRALTMETRFRPLAETVDDIPGMIPKGFQTDNLLAAALEKGERKRVYCRLGRPMR